MIGEKRGDHKGRGKGKARGGKLWNSQPLVENSAFGNGMINLRDSGNFLRRYAAVVKRKGLPCIILPEEVRAEP
jgi:hypothetical protein